MTMAVSDIETQDLLKSIDAKLDSIVTIMAKIAQGFKNLQDPTRSENVQPDAESRSENVQDHRPNMVTDDPFGPHPNIYENSMRMEKEFAEDEIERLQNELERTRKALEKAKVVLANLRDYAELDGMQECDVYEALEQITALEQKE